MTDPIIFDRRRHALHMARAAKAPEEFLLREMAERLCDRLSDTTRSFPAALVLSPLPHIVAEYIPASAGVETMTAHAVAEEEYLPFEASQFDLVMSCGSLHWINDVPGMLAQIQRTLKPDGLFLATMPGGETLKELRASFEQAEMMERGGVSPRVSPFIDIRDAGTLLQRAGFALPVVDSEILNVAYTHPLKLLHDLRAMGQTNALAASHKGMTPVALMMLMADHYMQNFSREDGRVNASFELVTMTGWKPHASQPKPLARGSGKARLTEILCSGGAVSDD